MQSHRNAVQNKNGEAVNGATVSIYNSGTATLSTIYSDNLSTAKTNPITTGSEGEFEFWAANGRYDVTTTYGSQTDSYEIILFDSVEDPILLDGGSDLEIGDPGSEVGGVDVNGATYDAKLRINDIGGTKPAQIVAHRHSTTLPAVLLGTRANSDTSTHAAVTNSQELFDIIGGGWTGTHYDLFGSINFQVDASGTISATSSPGAIFFKTTPDASNTPTTAMVIDKSQNVGIGTATFGTSAAKVLGLANGTAPTTAPANTVQLYSVDSSDVTATLGIFTEQAVEAIGTFTASHKLKVLINGVEYHIQLDAV